MSDHSNCGCSGLHRRTFLADVGMGFTGLALGALLHEQGVGRVLASEPHGPSSAKPPDGIAHIAPKAKSVIWLFMIGGTSHVEGFDPKPALTAYAGKTIAETPFKDALTARFVKENLRVVVPDDANGHIRQAIFPLQAGYRKRGESGIEVSDWWPNVGDCIDDIAVIRSMWTTDNNHGAQLQFHTGRHSLDGAFPTIGSWVHYGLGALSDELPKFVVLGKPLADCCGGTGGHGSNYLGPEHAGVHINVGSKEPLPFTVPASDVYLQEQAKQFELLRKLNKQSEIEYPHDPAVRARIKSYELAFRMQMSVPRVLDNNLEPKHVHEMYGLNQNETRPFGGLCLTARRLVEQGVRFVQVYHGGDTGAGEWDSHAAIKTNHSRLCKQVDLPIAGLLRDLKQRGLLEETLVVWATEFGRTPGGQNSDGRDHHPFGFSVWMAGGGIKGGIAHGSTDELGFHAVTDRHYVTDLHATVLHQLGLDARRLEVPGRKRLEMDFGQPIGAVMA